MSCLLNIARSTASRSTLRTAALGKNAASAAQVNLNRSAIASPASLSNSFVTWAPTSEPKLSAKQQNPGPPPPVENIGVDAM